MAELTKAELEARLKQLLVEMESRPSPTAMPADASSALPADPAVATDRAVMKGLHDLLIDVRNRPLNSAAAQTDDSVALRDLDERLSMSDPEGALQYLYIREGIVRQNEYMKDRAHLRQMERRELAMKVGMSAMAVATGTGLVVGGFGLPGFVCLGAGLYWLAPRFVDRVSKRVLGGRDVT